MTKRRVVITGMGAVTPIGKNINDFWAAIREGKCGVGPITLFDASNCPVKIAAEVKDFKPEEHDIDPKEARRMARFTQFLLAASKEAVKDASLTPEDLAADTTGIVAGTGLGGLDIVDSTYTQYINGGKRKVSPLAMPQLIPNEAGANVSIALGITGQAHTVCTACASGTDAIGVALDAIRSGRLDICLAGGSESGITDYSIKSFAGMHALTDKFNDCPEKASRPFDLNRSGFVMGEGGAVLILEELKHAKARGAKIYAELAGYGASADAYHITSPRPGGETCAKALTRAIKDAGIAPTDINYYNAHGTSTHLNDATETAMLKVALGEHAYKIKVSSTKSMTGHCVGAAGVCEAIVSTLAIRDSFYPATINYETPDPECDLDYVPNKGVEGNIDVAASASLGFGGHNGVVIIKKYKE
ncbi:MAG: beta-ketoacyl-ACP synthase II [Fibrobacter sp.]|nr:beta-ketoacyl-ACP synthase II [Fibrobacter sp.]